MKEPKPRQLAQEWYDAWSANDLDRVRAILCEDFVHESPFGVLSGRERYLEVVGPMARGSVVDLEVHEMVESQDLVVVRFTNTTPEGPIPSTEWIRVEDRQIVKIESFYDAGPARRSLGKESY